MKHHTTRAAALLTALTLCAASAWAAMLDAEFLALCKKGTVAQVRKALKDGANPNARNERGAPALFLALGNEKNPEVLKALLDAGADPNARDKDGKTALMAATLDDNPPAIWALLKAGADVNAQHQGVTALTYWPDCCGGDEKLAPPKRAQVVRLLLGAGADPTGGCRPDDDDCKPQLVREAGRVDAATIQAYMEYGGDVRALGGDAALMEAVRYNENPGVVKALLSAGAGANLKDEALRTAASFWNLHAVRELLAAGANCRAQDANGHDALWHTENPDSGYNDPRAFHDESRKAAVIRLLQQGGGTKKPAKKKRKQ
ncbi:MAG: ankyrin repeat domain-containing protein [Ottowia sp.]|nr:ankyrin repeat domain-containing protein [Ottowia sp.]